MLATVSLVHVDYDVLPNPQRACGVLPEETVNYAMMRWRECEVWAMNEHPLISEDRDILGGLPVFYGTRVPVQNLVDYLTTGETIDAFLDDFPAVTREQVEVFLKQSS